MNIETRRENTTTHTVSFGRSEVQQMIADAACAAVGCVRNASVRWDLKIIDDAGDSWLTIRAGSRCIVTMTIDHEDPAAPAP